MDEFKLIMLGGIPQKENSYSIFEAIEILSIESVKAMKSENINVYRGLNYMGISINENLICLDTNGFNKHFIKFDADVHMLSSSTDGRFALILLKNKYIYLIYVPTKRIIYKKAIEMSEFDSVNCALILTVNENVSEIWIFLTKSVIIYRRLYLIEIEKAISCNEEKEKVELFSQIKIEKKVFPFLRLDEELIHIKIMKCKRVDQFLMAILYSASLIILRGHFENNMSYIDFSYETNFDDFDISVSLNKQCMDISPDESHVFILDEQGTLWICNFIMGCISGMLRADKASYIDVVLSPGLIVVKKKSNDKRISLDILSFPSLKNIENFDISINSVIFPMLPSEEPILVIDMPNVSDHMITLKSIHKLDANIRLREIIDSNNFEYAFKFAQIFNLDTEHIYIHQLKYILDLKRSDQILLDEQCSLLFQCLKETKHFFDVEVFERLLHVIMPSTKLHHNFLKELYSKTITAPDGIDKATFSTKIEKEIHKFEIFKMFSAKSRLSIIDWICFRLKDSIAILFMATSIEYADILLKVWIKMKDEVNSIYQCKDGFFVKMLTLIQNMLAQNCNVAKLENLLFWFVDEIFPQQIIISPSHLFTVTNIFENIIKLIEASPVKMSINVYINVLRMADELFNQICFLASTLMEKAQVEEAGLMNLSEEYNPALSLLTLKTQLIQLNRLQVVYNLDLNLALLKEESKINLASRLLDQISTNDLYNNKDLPKLKDFLKEFNLSSCEFFYSYIKRLILQVPLMTDDDIENRFIILITHIPNRQLILECLIEYASKVEVPFRENLSQLIEKEILNNSVNNSAVRRLQCLQRKSNLTPLLNRYGIHYDTNRVLLPESLLKRILYKESSVSSKVFNEDINHLVNEYKLDDLIVINARCNVYVYNVIYEDDLVAIDSLTKLKVIVNCESYPHSMKSVIVEKCFESFNNIFSTELKVSFSKLHFVLEAVQWITSKLYNKDQALYWKHIFDTLIFCMSLGYEVDDKCILFSELICHSDVTFLHFPQNRYQVIKKCVDIKLKKVVSSVSLINNYTHKDVSKEVAKSVKDIETFCLQSSSKDDLLLLEIYKDSFHELITYTATEEHHLAGCLLYSYLNVMFKWSVSQTIKFEYCFDWDIVLCLKGCELSNNVHLLWDIMKTLTKLISLYVYQDIGYLYKDFFIVFRIVNFFVNIARIYTELQSPSFFERNIIHNIYKEVPQHFESINKIINLVEYGINVISSKNKDSFQNSVDTFIHQTAIFVSYFWKEGLTLLGCFSIVDSIAFCNNLKDVTVLNDLFNINSKKTYLFHILEDVLRMSEIDALFAVSVLSLLPRESMVNKTKSVMQKCKSSKKMLVICAITIEVLGINNGVFSLEEMKESFTHILPEARKHYWAKVLKPYHISMFKTADKSRIKLKCMELLNNYNVPVDIVEEFAQDFELYKKHTNIELLGDVFSTDLNQCNSFYSYKIKVEALLQRAEKIWTSIPSHDKDYELVSTCFDKVLNFTSPYHYEIIQYAYERLYSVSFCNEYEPKVIKLLNTWTRSSPVSEVERQYCQINYIQEGLPNPLSATYLVCKRLPFNVVVSHETMAVLEQELHSTNVNLWINLYTLLNKIGGHSHAMFNPDLLQLQAVENLFSDFIKYSKVPDNNTDNTTLFLGNLYEESSGWFKETMKLGISFFDQLIVYSSFVDTVKKMLNQILVGEQRIHLINIALNWIECRLSFEPCNSKDILIAWKKEIIILKTRLTVEKILFECNLYKDEYLDLIPNFSSMLEVILNTESIVLMIPKNVRENIIKAVKEISRTTSIDLGDFSVSLLMDTLKLSSLDHLDVSTDHDSSMLNVSVDSTTSDFKDDGKSNPELYTRGIELLSTDSDILKSLTKKLFQFLTVNVLNLKQWIRVLTYLLRCSHSCDYDQNVSVLINIHNYRLLVLINELHSIGADIVLFGESNLSELLNYLQKFSLEDKTYLIMRLYCGDSYRKSYPKLKEAPNKKNISILQELLVLCPESINMNDESIKELASKL